MLKQEAQRPHKSVDQVFLPLVRKRKRKILVGVTGGSEQFPNDVTFLKSHSC